MTDPTCFPPGKLPVDVLEGLLRTHTSTIHGVVAGASIGEDAAAIDIGEKYLLAKTDADVGLVVDEDRIPILDDCRVLCRHFGLDPLGLIASGSLLITVEPSDGGKVICSLKEAGISARKIKRITTKEEGVKIGSKGRIMDLPRFARDEIARILESAWSATFPLNFPTDSADKTFRDSLFG